MKIFPKAYCKYFHPLLPFKAPQNSKVSTVGEEKKNSTLLSLVLLAGLIIKFTQDINRRGKNNLICISGCPIEMEPKGMTKAGSFYTSQTKKYKLCKELIGQKTLVLVLN